MQLAPLAQRVAAIVSVARRWLDLDHVGAEVGHHSPGERPGDQLSELEHPQAGERTRCGVRIGRTLAGIHRPASACGGSAPSLTVRRSRNACAIVLGSTYSSSLPTGTPRASRVTLSPRARISSPM